MSLIKWVIIEATGVCDVLGVTYFRRGHDVIIVYLLLILLILVNFKSLLWHQFLTDFHKQGSILKL